MSTHQTGVKSVAVRRATRRDVLQKDHGKFKRSERDEEGASGGRSRTRIGCGRGDASARSGHGWETKLAGTADSKRQLL